MKTEIKYRIQRMRATSYERKWENLSDRYTFLTPESLEAEAQKLREKHPLSKFRAVKKTTITTVSVVPLFELSAKTEL